jgi:hypothetical protein
MGEETSTPLVIRTAAPTGRSTLRMAIFWALPDLGRGSWENAALVDTGTTTHVAFLLGDDAQAHAALPLRRRKECQAANFVERNGLKRRPALCVEDHEWQHHAAAVQRHRCHSHRHLGGGECAEHRQCWHRRARCAGLQERHHARHEAGRSAASFSRVQKISAPAPRMAASWPSPPPAAAACIRWITGVTPTSSTSTSMRSAVPTCRNMRILYDGDDAGGGQFMTS